MELFLAQNHEPMTHLPIATSLLAAAVAIALLFVDKPHLRTAWAMLVLIASITVIPTIMTGIFVAKGRYNDKGKPYIENGVQVAWVPENTRIARHQVLGVAGFVVALGLSWAAIGQLRGKVRNKIAIAVASIALAAIWAVGSHIGGQELWGPDTFPAYEQETQDGG